MLNRKQKLSVFTDLKNDETAHTLLSMLLALTIISFAIPFISILIKSINYVPIYDFMSAQHFFYVLRDELLHSDDYDVKRNKIYLYHSTNRTSTIELHGSVVRQLVDGTGHIVLIHKVKQITFSKLNYGIHVTITLADGDIFEKTIVFYK